MFYRATAQARGRELGLHGWVRNLPDGRVEALAEGPRPALEAFLAWAREGPPHARVSAVATTWDAATGTLGAFRVQDM